MYTKTFILDAINRCLALFFFFFIPLRLVCSSVNQHEMFRLFFMALLIQPDTAVKALRRTQ